MATQVRPWQPGMEQPEGTVLLGTEEPAALRIAPSASGDAEGVGTAPGAATLPCGSCGRDMPADEMEPLEDHRRHRWYRCFECRDAADARWREAYGPNFHELDPVLQRELDGDR